MRPSVYERLAAAPAPLPNPLPEGERALPVNPTAIVDALGYPAAGLGILIESAGVPFPGEALLLAAAAGRSSNASGTCFESGPSTSLAPSCSSYAMATKQCWPRASSSGCEPGDRCLPGWLTCRSGASSS